MSAPVYQSALACIVMLALGFANHAAMKHTAASNQAQTEEIVERCTARRMRR